MSSRSRSRSRNVISEQTKERLRTAPIGTHGSMSVSSKKDNSIMNYLSRSIRSVLNRRKGGKRKNTKRKTQKKRKTRKVRRNQK